MCFCVERNDVVICCWMFIYMKTFRLALIDELKINKINYVGDGAMVKVLGDIQRS